jgi:hypothetical protein
MPSTQPARILDEAEAGPSPLSTSPVPSSFEGTGFFEESRWQKFSRKLIQEPLIPLGCAATCYALYQASKSIRQGNPMQTNKMFRHRIYAQGFTLVAIVAGGIFYKDERVQRKKFEETIEEKKQAERREKWLKELEARDEEDKAWRENIERQTQVATKGLKSLSDETKKVVEANYGNKSMRDQINRDRWVWRTSEAWRRF